MNKNIFAEMKSSVEKLSLQNLDLAINAQEIHSTEEHVTSTTKVQSAKHDCGKLYSSAKFFQ